MKKLKSLGIIALCICLIAGVFAGCTKKISLEGTWKTTIDLTDFVKQLDLSGEEDGEYYGTFDESLSVDLLYTFDSENAFTVSIDEEKFKTDYDALCEKYYDYAVEGAYKYGEANGLTRAQMDEFYQEDYGMSIRESLVDELAMEEAYTEFVNEVQTTEKQATLIEDDRAYETDEQGNKTGYETFVLEGDTLTITGSFDMEDKPVKDNENFVYPMIFTKQAAQAAA